MSRTQESPDRSLLGTELPEDPQYLALWRRMRRVVEVFTAAQCNAEAEYFMADFFMCFDDMEELRRHVVIAEQAAQERKE